jgi:hypothetical protein
LRSNELSATIPSIQYGSLKPAREIRCVSSCYRRYTCL